MHGYGDIYKLSYLNIYDILLTLCIKARIHHNDCIIGLCNNRSLKV